MTLEIAAQARERLFSIWSYFRDESSENRAVLIEERLLKRASELIANPFERTTGTGAHRIRPGDRFLLLGRFRIIYRSIGDVIHITDFFDTKQHPSRMRG